jgi:tRNA1(Val) A37 N6-methylase TrmN6
MLLKPVLLPFGKTIYQTDQGQAVSSDNVYLTELILQNENEQPINAMDLGCGNGILTLMLAHYRPDWKVSGIEIQPHLVDLARKNAQMIQAVNVAIYQHDLRLWDNQEKYDLIFSNPPYYQRNSGRISPVSEKAISRHEILCTMSDILNFIKKYLRNTGRAYLIYPLERESDMQKFSKKVDLIIDREFFFNKTKKELMIFSLIHRKEYVKNR